MTNQRRNGSVCLQFECTVQFNLLALTTFHSSQNKVPLSSYRTMLNKPKCNRTGQCDIKMTEVKVTGAETVKTYSNQV